MNLHSRQPSSQAPAYTSWASRGRRLTCPDTQQDHAQVVNRGQHNVAVPYAVAHFEAFSWVLQLRIQPLDAILPVGYHLLQYSAQILRVLGKHLGGSWRCKRIVAGHTDNQRDLA